MLFTVGIDEDALNFVELEKSNETIFVIYKILCLSRLGRLHEADNVVKEMLREKKSVGTQMIVDLLAILVKRNELSNPDGRTAIDGLIRKYKRQEHTNVGFLLRAANIFHTPEAALPLLEQSVCCFRKA